MKKIDIFENGIYLQFYVNDENNLYFYNCSTNKAEVPQRLIEIPEEESLRLSNQYWAVEVQIAGASSTRGKHIGHQCPTIPTFVDYSDTRNDKGRLVVVTLATEVLEIKQHYQFYDGIQVISAFSETKNLLKENAPLEYVSSFCYGGFIDGDLETLSNQIEILVPHNSWSDELNLRPQTLKQEGFNTRRNDGSSNRFRLSNRGSWPTKEHLPMGGLENGQKGEYYLWQIENNGSWTWELSDLNDLLILRLSGPSEQEHSWYKVLKSGETFKSVPTAIAVTAGGLESATCEMTKYRRRIINDGRIDKSLPVVVNDYMYCLLADPTTEKVMPIVEKAAELGAEIYCMDAGWYAVGDWWPLVGEWEICEERFSGGLKEIFDRIKALGMRGGIWLEPEVMGVNCPLVPEFEDCFYTFRGNKIVSKGRYQLDFRKEKVINHLNKVIDNLINHLGVSFFKFDYNIEPLYGTENDADSGGDGLMKCREAYLKWVDSLYERYPDLIIENCASGGMRMDYASLKHFALQSVSDAAFYNEFAHMSVMAPVAVIPEQTGIWVVTNNDNTKNENAAAAVNAMTNRMYISGRIDLLRDEDFASLKESVSVYKNMRHDLVNCLPIFPCGICNYDSDWMVGGRITEDRGAVYLSVVNMRDTVGQKEIHIPEFGKFTAEILYPSGVGQISVSNSTLKVDLPQKSAFLLKLTKKL